MHDSELKKHQIISRLIAYVRCLPAFKWHEPTIREGDGSIYFILFYWLLVQLLATDFFYYYYKR